MTEAADEVDDLEGSIEHEPRLGPEAELVTDGAKMKRVDHPGAPGVESVLVEGAAEQTPSEGRTSERGEYEPGGTIETGLWGSGDVAAPTTAPVTTPLTLDSRTLQRLTRRGTDRMRHRSGRRSMSSRGRSIGAVPMVGPPRDIAWEATLRAVAHRQSTRAHTDDLAFVVEVEELLKRRRVRPPDHLLLLVVDASGSMASKLTAAARELAVRALKNAYVERQRVAMIAFRSHGAELLFGPTKRVERARRALDKLPLGGGTPLGRGLDLAHQTLRRAAIQTTYGHTTVLIISDGDANIGNPRGYSSTFLDAEQAARKLVAVPNTEIILLDTTEAGKDNRPALWLAKMLNAQHIQLSNG